MRITQDHRNWTSGFARLSAAILFVLVAGTGYTISPRVEGAVSLSAGAEEQDFSDVTELAPECVGHGLILSDCGLDF